MRSSLTLCFHIGPGVQVSPDAFFLSISQPFFCLPYFLNYAVHKRLGSTSRVGRATFNKDWTSSAYQKELHKQYMWCAQSTYLSFKVRQVIAIKKFNTETVVYAAELQRQRGSVISADYISDFILMQSQYFLLSISSSYIWRKLFLWQLQNKI